MSHQIPRSPDWAAAETWLLGRAGDHVRQNALRRARVVVPAGTLARRLQTRSADLATIQGTEI